MRRTHTGIDSLAGQQRCISPGRARAAPTERSARGRRRSLTGAPAARLSAGHLPLVQRGRADPVVEPGPAHGVVSGRAQDRALARQDAAQAGLRDARRHGLRSGDRCLQRAAAAPARDLDHCTDEASLLRVCTSSGVAHSVETWRDGELVGGLYGIALGRMFYGESMFSRVSDASKIALVALVQQLTQWQFGLIDCQMNTPLLASFGAREIPRSQFTRLVAELVNYPDVPAPWMLRAASASSVRTSPA